MSVLSEAVKRLTKDAKVILDQHAREIKLELGAAAESRTTDAIAKLPTAEALGQRILGNPRLKAWLKTQPAEVQAAIRDAAQLIATCAIESITKDLLK